MAEILVWLPPWWPLGLVLLLLVVAVATRWDELLGWPPGKYWPAVAAILAPLIPVVRSFEDNALPSGQALTVAGMLLAIAATQVYGQARAERYRKLADAEVSSIAAEVEKIADRGRQQLGFLAEQGAQLVDIADAIGSLADEISDLKESLRERGF